MVLDTSTEGEARSTGPPDRPTGSAGPGGRRLELRHLTGLGPVAAEAEALMGGWPGAPCAVAPVAVAPRGADLLVAYPLLEGDLRAAVARQGLSVCAAVARAVAQLHRAGVVHGALGVSNIRITAEGEVRLLEVGLAAIDSIAPPTEQDDVRALVALLSEMAASVQPTEDAGRLRTLLGRHPKRIPSAQSLADELCRPSPERGGRGTPRRRAASVPPASLRTALVVMLALGLAVVLVLRARSGGRAASPSRRARPVAAAVGCTPQPLPAGAGAWFMAVDLNGSGCAEPLAWRAGTAVTETPGGRLVVFRVGRPGDVLLVGHFGCRRDLPALYRPGTGQVFYMPAWPDGRAAVTSAPAVQTGVRYGTARIAGTTRCQHVEVRP